MSKEKFKFPQVRKNYIDISNSFSEAAKLENPFLFYTEDFLNYKSCLITEEGKKQPVTDYIAQRLLANPIISNISDVTNPEKYLVGHDGKQKKITNRIEERFAKALFTAHQNNIDKFKQTDFGYIVDYQTPITRDSSTTGYGKIDLISISDKKQKNYLLELKRSNSEETLLRAVCEIYTYFKQIQPDNLIKELPNNYDFVPAVLVFENSFQHKQYEFEKFYNNIPNPYANVKELMKKLGVKMFIISSTKAFDSSHMMPFAQNCTITEI